MKTKWITFKLRDAAAADAAIKRLSQIPGIVQMERLFDDETDPQLVALYTAEVDEPSNTDSVCQQLRSDKDVEYADCQLTRQLH